MCLTWNTREFAYWASQLHEQLWCCFSVVVVQACDGQRAMNRATFLNKHNILYLKMRVLNNNPYGKVLTCFSHVIMGSHVAHSRCCHLENALVNLRKCWIVWKIYQHALHVKIEQKWMMWNFPMWRSQNTCIACEHNVIYRCKII